MKDFLNPVTFVMSAVIVSWLVAIVGYIITIWR